MHDLVIRNGTIIDGTGKPGVKGDVAIDGERITAVGRVTEPGYKTIEAKDRLVTPGFVDTHTHMDGQFMWDPLGTPACWHGITTLVLGSCGVSFAPVKKTDHMMLAKVLESVEGIPAESIMASLLWNWETFGEYYDALDACPKGVNVCGMIGHVATRHYALGEESVDKDRQPTPDELKTMGHLVDEAMEAGALGFSTSRTLSHRTSTGVPIPGTFAHLEELVAMAQAVGRHNKGVFQWAPGFGEYENYPTEDYPEARKEIHRIAEVNRQSGRPVIFSAFTHKSVPTIQTLYLGWLDEERAAGADARPMVSSRVNTVMVGLCNWMPNVRDSAGWRDLYNRPYPERLTAIQDEATRRQLLDVPADSDERLGKLLYIFGPEECSYVPTPENLLANVAAANGERPVETIVRLLCETDGRQLFNYATNNHNIDHVEEVLTYRDTILGLGDAGAHVNAICDASLTTHALTHWHKERNIFSLEETIRRLTSDGAEAFQIPQRGVLKPGYYADVNVIDFDNLRMEVPEFVFDLPVGAGRWTQRAQGYDYTIVNGQIVIENDCHAGRLVGDLIRI